MSKKAQRALPRPPSALNAEIKELSKLSVDEIVAKMFPAPEALDPQAQPQPTEHLDDLSVDALIERSGAVLNTNEVTGEAMPAFADGSSPETPMNKSVLSATERFKLSLGGDQNAKIKFLKERYEDAGLDTDGDFVIKKEGNWYSADSKDGFIGNVKNAFDLSAKLAKSFLFAKGGRLKEAGAQLQDSEMLGDIAEAVPLVGAVAAQIGVAAMTKGRSLLVQGATAGAVGAGVNLGETSMGKYVGTYEGTPEDQIQEAGVEFLLNAGGQTILPGMSQAATKMRIVDALSKAGTKLNGLNPISKASLTDFVANVTKVEKPQIQRYLDRPNNVMAYVNKFAKIDNYEAVAFEEQLKLVTKAAPMARATLSSNYGKNLATLAGKVGDDFAIDVSQPAKESLAQMHGMGLIQLENKGGQVVGRLRTEKELANYIEKNGGSEALQSIAGNKEAYSLIKDFYRSVESRAKEIKPIKGPDALKRYQQMDSSLGKSFNDFKNKAKDLRLTAVMDEFAPVVKGMQSNLDNQIERNLAKSGKQDILQGYRILKSTYREGLEEADALLDIADIAKVQGNQAARNRSAQLIDRLVGGGKLSRLKQSTRGNLNEGVETLTDLNPEIGRMFDKVKDIEAGYQFTPRLNKSFAQFGPIQLSIGATGALLSGGDPQKLGIMGGTALGAAYVAAPRTLLRALSANKKVAQVFGKALITGRQGLIKMSPEQRDALLANPQLLKDYQGAIVNSVQQYMGTHEALMNQIPQGQ